MHSHRSFQSFMLKAAVLIYNVNNNDKSPVLILITVIHQRQVVLGGTCQAVGTLKRLLLLAEASHENYPQRSANDQTAFHHTGYHERRQS